MKHLFSLYIHDLKVAAANFLMIATSFSQLDLAIKVFAFIIGSIYTVQRIVYNWEKRQEEKEVHKKFKEDNNGQRNK